MARKWSNLNLPGALHFVTGNCVNRLPVFTEPEVLHSVPLTIAKAEQGVASKTDRLHPDA
jgi:hypothetical protein